MEIRGAKQLEKRLNEFGPKVAKKVIRKSMRAGAAIIRNRTKVNTPRVSGDLRRSIITRKAKGDRKGTFALLQLFNVKKFPDLIRNNKTGKRAFYPASVEYGRAAPGDFGGSKVTKPQRFIRRSFDESSDQAAQKILHDLRVGIEEAWLKEGLAAEAALSKD